MQTLSQLVEQRVALENQIRTLQMQMRSEGVAKVVALMSEYGLTKADISPNTPQPFPAKRAKVAAKYRDASTGQAWSGRGLQPKWLKQALSEGKQLADFAV